MPADAKCMPGQDGTEAVAPAPLTIRPVTGDFGSTQGTVRLISNKNPSKAGPMTVRTWAANAIGAAPPAQNPGTGDHDETFKVEVSVNGTVTHVATPVLVTGVPTGGYPPAHPPAH